MHVVTVIGARPQFVKAAVVRRSLVRRGIRETLVHTGQHYDRALSAVFFEELGLPAPEKNLEVGSGTHALQTGRMMMRLERFIEGSPCPDWVMVYGDTNSTLAGALVASKRCLPLVHVEAGLRSFNRRMPEEINRVVTDHLSSLLFCPTLTAVENLGKEGITEGVHLTGDVMLDATRLFSALARERKAPASLRKHGSQGYYLATVHRAENTDVPERLAGIVEGLGRLDAPVSFPVHPRTREKLRGMVLPEHVEVMPPVGYMEMLALVWNARAVLTDSGGLQKESAWLNVPCVTLRDETEWVETLERGWNRLVGTNPARIAAAAAQAPEPPAPTIGEPGASDRIAEILLGG